MAQEDPFVDAQPIQAATTREMAHITHTAPTTEFDQAQVPQSRENSPVPSQITRPSFKSPSSIPNSSITPPPSTQVHSQQQTIARTPSPSVALLNSPPPTTKYERLLNAPAVVSIPSREQIENATTEELKLLLSDVCGTLREARTNVAHYKLQYEMLGIESNKAKNEMQVELAMLQRELDVLQEAENSRRAASTPLQSIEASNLAAIHDLTRQVDILSLQNKDLQIALSREREITEHREVRVVSLEEHNNALRQRIRENREHMNGILDNVLERSPTSVFNTPTRSSYYGTPRRAPLSTPARHAERRDNGAIDALLLAGEVLQQKIVTAPSTPRTQGRHGRPGHTRNTHSLSSLPSTPHRRIHLGGQALRTPQHLASILEPGEPSVLGPHSSGAQRSNRRRRASSNSTISASEDERERARASTLQTHARPPYDAVPESSASQVATSMLRSTPKKPKTQSKLTGKVTKSTVTYPNKMSSQFSISPEKRRVASGLPGPEAERPGSSDGSPKKRKVGNVGLGIGL